MELKRKSVQKTYLGWNDFPSSLLSLSLALQLSDTFLSDSIPRFFLIYSSSSSYSRSLSFGVSFYFRNFCLESRKQQQNPLAFQIYRFAVASSDEDFFWKLLEGSRRSHGVDSRSSIGVHAQVLVEILLQRPVQVAGPSRSALQSW